MADVPILRQLAIHSTQVIFLREVARRNGEMRFTWDNARPDVKALVADLLDKRILRYVEVVSSADQAHGPTYLVLTDTGRRVVAQIDAAENKKTEIESGAPEVKVTA